MSLSTTNFSGNKKVASFFLAVLIFSCTKTFAQQEWVYSQYLFNLYDINSAYAGNHQAPSFALRYRSQWMGFEGAPISQQLSFHTPLMQNKLGAGLRFQNESIGIHRQMLLQTSAAYKLKIKTQTLSIGFSIGAIKQQFNIAEITIRDGNDVQLAGITNSTILPTIGLSAFLNSDNYYAGIDASRLNRSNFNITENSLARLYFNLSAVAGYIKKIDNDNLLQFSTLLKFTEGNIWQGELNILFLRNNKFWFGGGYRYPSCMDIMLCIHITSQLRFGLSYDYSLSPLPHQFAHTTEAFLGFNLKPSSNKSIRYF